MNHMRTSHTRLLLAGALAILATGGAPAAQISAPTAGRSAPPAAAQPRLLPAPVGHRQPKSTDLPGDEIRSTGFRSDFADLESKLRICRC
jgi:hypothetical protein